MEVLQNEPVAQREFVQRATAETKVTSQRYERKFGATALDRQSLELIVKSNPALFRPIYAPRYINNIYLDTPGFSSYGENLAGIAHRTKIRIRWYGALFGPIQRPVLEFKIKNGLAGYKLSWPLLPFSLDEKFRFDDLRHAFRLAGLPDTVREQLHSLEPALLNRYHRSYYLSGDRQFRITLDEALSYIRIDRFSNAFLHRYEDRERKVLELKYAIEQEERAGQIANVLPFRVSRFSKYVMGVQALWGLSD